jgi:hypothetical protein
MMKFTIPGNPQGYYAQGARSKWKMSAKQRERTEKYRAYQQLVRIFAGQHLKLPLKATRNSPVYIGTVSYFRNGVHCDPGNVQKGICDALFLGGSGDKYTAGWFDSPRYDKDNPRVEVEVRFVDV